LAQDAQFALTAEARFAWLPDMLPHQMRRCTAGLVAARLFLLIAPCAFLTSPKSHGQTANDPPHEHTDVTILHYFGYDENTEWFRVRVRSVDTKNVYVLWLDSSLKDIRTSIGQTAVVSIYDGVWKKLSLGQKEVALIRRLQRIE
jgi:hypothetical protein